MLLEVKNLHANINGVEILKGINLSIREGEVHAIMGPNGSGKSTLAKIIAGHPSYEVTSGEVLYDINFKPRNLLQMEPYERARNGVFLAFQYPIEIPGVSNFTFLKTAFNAVCEQQGVPPLSDDAFRSHMAKKMELVDLSTQFMDRAVNEGFSGGEKKRNEILQMAVLAPRLALLDETDSGLDIDALRIVANGVNQLKRPENATILVTHYQRLLEYIVPDFVHVLYNGRIIESGDKSLALKLEEKGYDWLIAREELH